MSALKNAVDDAITAAGAATTAELQECLRKQGFSKNQVQSTLKTELDLLCRQGYRRVREGYRILIVRELDGAMKLSQSGAPCCQSWQPFRFEKVLLQK